MTASSNYRQEFIDFMLHCGVLRFGSFTTKSGRQTPYFINTGLYDTGAKMLRLGHFYARAIQEQMAGEFDVLYGPAYKGIPLAVAASMALAKEHGVDVPFAFNRKEAKDHGEGGSIIGHQIKSGDRILIIEDVTTAGTSVRETHALLGSIAGSSIVGLVVSVDRQERGRGKTSALQELREEFGIRTFAIVTLDDIVAYLAGRELDEEMLRSIAAYRAEYGA